MTNIYREYAEALFSLAMEEGNPEQVGAALGEMENALEENPDFLRLLSSPAIPRHERMKALSAAFEGRMPLSALTAIRLMISRGHAAGVPQMMAEWKRMLLEKRGEGIARVITAVPLTDKQREALETKLGRRFGKKMTLECRVDPGMLGGVRVEAEGRVMDGTLKNRLEQIKEVMDS